MTTSATGETTVATVSDSQRRAGRFPARLAGPLAKRRESPRTIGFWGVVLVAGLASGVLRAADRPNVVVVLADDLGYADVSCYGGKILTPHIDRLAATGIRFTDAHSSSSVCSPTRYGLLTGRYNWRSRLKRSVLGGLSPRLIEPDRVTLAGFLQGQGYHTACIGKWHLGMDWKLKPGKQVTPLGIEPREQVFNVEYGSPIANGPPAVGFDYFFGISASLDMVPYAYIENDRVTELPTEDRDFPMMDGRQSGRTRKGPTAPGFDAADVLPMLVRKSVDYIDDRVRTGESGGNRQPFFLYVPLASPHTPILPTPPWHGKSGINPYADFVMESDWAVGQIVAALERAGVAENTLIVFTSDNGCSPQAKFDELAEHDHYPSGPLRGHKADLFEGGHRVPFVVNCPGATAEGMVSEQLVCLTDIFATVAATIGGDDLAADMAEDSFSFLPALRGQTSASGVRESLVSHSINGSFAIRRGDWKLMLCGDSGGWSTPRPGSPAAGELPARQLYHLGEDLAEQENRITDRPEVAAELLELLQNLVAEGRSTPGPRQENTGAVTIEPGH